MRAFGGGPAERLRRRMTADVAALELPAGPADRAPVSEADLADLPGAAQRYLRFMGVADRTPDWSFQAHFTGQFRLRPGQRWMPCQSWQYSSGLEVARVFHIRASIGGVLPMLARDTYLHGRGRMRGTLLGLLRVADASGPEMDLGELVTYLNDAIIFAPSMLLGLPISWQGAGDDAFDVALEDAGRRVTARVYLDEQGAPVDFSTEDRYAALPGGLVRTRWSTPVTGWRPVGGRPLPARGQAIWHLPAGAFSYASLAFGPGDLTYNLAPGDTGLWEAEHVNRDHTLAGHTGQDDHDVHRLRRGKAARRHGEWAVTGTGHRSRRGHRQRHSRKPWPTRTSTYSSNNDPASPWA